MVYVTHSISAKYRERLIDVANKLDIPLHIVMGGVQNKNFQSSLQKRAEMNSVFSESQINKESSTVEQETEADYDRENEDNRIENNDGDEENEEDKNDNLKKVEKDYEHYYKGKRQNHNYTLSNPYFVRPKRFRRKNKKLSTTPRLGNLRGVMKFVSKSQVNIPATSFGGKMLTRAASRAQKNAQEHLNADVNPSVEQPVRANLADKQSLKQPLGKTKEITQPEDNQEAQTQISFCPGIEVFLLLQLNKLYANIINTMYLYHPFYFLYRYSCCI